MTRKHDRQQHRHATKTFERYHSYEYLAWKFMERTKKEQVYNCDVNEETDARVEQFEPTENYNVVVRFERMSSQDSW
jgi:hypothetical protein